MTDLWDELNAQRGCYVELSDMWDQSEPLAFLVACPEDCVTCEYQVFASEDEARAVASRHGADAGRDWPVYPLYAAHALREGETK